MDKFNEQFPEFLRRIRLRYLLGFYAEPSSRREYHRIEVRLTPDAQRRFPLALIRARQGYYTQPIRDVARTVVFLPSADFRKSVTNIYKYICPSFVAT